MYKIKHMIISSQCLCGIFFNPDTIVIIRSLVVVTKITKVCMAIVTETYSEYLLVNVELLILFGSKAGYSTGTRGHVGMMR